MNYLDAGLIAGYCVGEPWNAVAAQAEAHPSTHEALLDAGGSRLPRAAREAPHHCRFAARP